MQFYSDDDIEKRARGARKLLGIEDQIFPDMMTVVHKLKDHSIIDSWLIVADIEMPNDEAHYDPYIRLLSIRQSVFEAANSGNSRARFTIAHEVGHIILGHNKIRHRRPDYDPKSTASGNVVADEKQANSFAAAFLAPFHLSNMDLETSAADIAEYFQIGLKAAEIRLPLLRRLYRIANGIQRPLPDSVIKFLAQYNKPDGPK